jgi:hypothetical protein
MTAAMVKAPVPRFTESAINELFTVRNFLPVFYYFFSSTPISSLFTFYSLASSLLEPLFLEEITDDSHF